MASFDIGKYFNIDTYIEFFNNLTTEVLIAMIIVLLALMIFFIIVNWKIYKKIGLHGWESLIPIYNTIVLLKKIGMSVINFFLLIIPIVNIFIYIELIRNLCASFGKGKLFTFFSILFPFFALPIIAFGSSSYIYDLNKNEDEDEPNIENVDSEYLYCPKCNTRLAQNAKSCFICGHKLVEYDNENDNYKSNVNNISTGAKNDNLSENNNPDQTNLELNNNINQAIGVENNNSNLLLNDINMPLNNENNNDNKNTQTNNNIFFNSTLVNNDNQTTSNNNVSSIEDMFNFHYDNINGNNNLNIDNNNPINVNNNGFMPVSDNQEKSDLVSFENNNNSVDLSKSSIPELDNNANDNGNEEILDFSINAVEENNESENTEILEFPTSELNLHSNLDSQNRENEETSFESVNSNTIEDVIPMSTNNLNPVIEDVVPDVLNNLNQNSSITNNDNYRVCPICGSKVLPNATNCVICGSKVS